MKLRVYFRPAPVALALVAVAGMFWLAFGATPIGPWFFPFALFYTALSALGLWSLVRIAQIEHQQTWSRPARLLILAPHEDDCVIAAGGIGVRNARVGGTTRVVYLATDETPGLPEVRAAEADLRHIPLLPPLHSRDPAMLRAAATALRAIIDEFEPTVIVVPMFEGGHIHHDMLAALLGMIVIAADTFEVFEAPEYSPYVSINNTPHRIIALCARWLFGLVSYYGPPDGIDGRPIQRFQLAPEELDIKRRMLACFTSQNSSSLVLTRAYPDRLVRMKTERDWRHPFDFAHSYLRLALSARRLLPHAIAAGLFPGATGTVGRDGGLTDWQQEWAPRA